MQFYIKEWSERRVALMIGGGQVLAYFSTIHEALVATRSWYQFNGVQPQAEIIIGDEKELAHDMVDLHSYGF